jgi:hypothetical protein
MGNKWWVFRGLYIAGNAAPFAVLCALGDTFQVGLVSQWPQGLRRNRKGKMDKSQRFTILLE